MNDLLAIAKVRRVLIEMGIEEDPGAGDMGMGAVESWVRMPSDDLAGRTPLEAMRTGIADEVVMSSLRKAVAANRNGAWRIKG